MQLGVAGSGFFINNEGYFVTTAHLFDGATRQTQFLYGGLLPENLQNPFLEIQEIARDNARDIYIGRIIKENTDFLKFANNDLEIGTTVCISGYPLAQITANAQGGRNLEAFAVTFNRPLSWILLKSTYPTQKALFVHTRVF